MESTSVRHLQESGCPQGGGQVWADVAVLYVTLDLIIA